MNENETTESRKLTMGFNHTCSHCGQVDRVELAVEVSGEKQPDPYRDWLSKLAPEIHKLVSEMERNGLLKAYQQTLMEVNGTTSRNPAKGFLNYLRLAGKMQLSSATQLVLLQQFGRGHSIEVLQHGGICALIVDGVLSMFAPKTILDAESLKNAESSRVMAVSEITKVSDSMSSWVRTKMGYVPKEAALFFKELRRRNVGEFARAMAQKAGQR